ncbi:MAG: cupin domain-containing protein [Gemmatimonadota bacterium]
MTSFDRPLAGSTMLLDLAEEIERTRAARSGGDTGRTARTLIKDGPLRVTLVVLEAGAEIPEHTAQGPITVQPVSGSIRFRVAGEEHVVATGSLLSAGAGVPHAVATDDGAVFLLTNVQPPRDG